jgi:hypothetical protein
MKNKFKVGQRVKSHYRANWSGVVVEVAPRKDATPLITVNVTHDRHGNLMRKTLIKHLDQGWLTATDEIAS